MVEEEVVETGGLRKLGPMEKILLTKYITLGIFSFLPKKEREIELEREYENYRIEK